MRLIRYKYTHLSVIVVILVFASFSVSSGDKVVEKPQYDNQSNTIVSRDNSLDIARLKLENAIDSYKKGNLAATQNNLIVASESLNKAAQHSATKKAEESAHKLAIEIDAFKGRIDQVSENSLSRFWHQVISIVKRESDQLIHDYVELSIAEKTLKHLLDAKMHLFIAEHDLYVSHGEEDAIEELNDVINYLDKASQVARPAIKIKVLALSQNIQSLKESIDPRKDGWKKINVILSLDNAIIKLTEANQNASPTLKLKIDLVKNDVRRLRDIVKRKSFLTDYDSSMAKLKGIIDQL